MTPFESRVRVGRYPNSRFWAVWLGSELLAVVVYKKGAEAVAALARNLEEAREVQPRILQAA
jgi:hypothetical protein